MYDSKSDRPRRQVSSARLVANPYMYYFKGMKCLSSMLNTLSDLIDIEIGGEEIQFKSDGKEDTAESIDQDIMHLPNDTYQLSHF